jgi:hypothetical protein
MGIHNLAQIINKETEVVIKPVAPPAPEPVDEDHIVRGED